tara:strand:+ start:368 stop:1381 length:1014 start_codon:yes stop_codon:yes gene_type:complete
MKKLFFTYLALIVIGATTLMAQRSSPLIKNLFVYQKEQGEQGVVQYIVKGIVESTEGENKLNYQYSILSGNATLEQIEKRAILNPLDDNKIVIKLKVTDSKGTSAFKTITYSTYKIDPKKLYRDEKTWNLAISQTFINHPAFTFQEHNEKLPNVLIIGNSISIGYTPYVQRELKGKCNVYRIPVNGGDTMLCLRKLDFWLGDSTWDVIHFNFGLHDLKRLKNNKLDITGKVVNTQEVYAANLNKIVIKLKTNTKSKLIWATTSVVPEGAEGRIKGVEVEYNRIAEKIMKDNQIIIDDQYDLTSKHPTEQKKENVHFLKEGMERQGKQVAKCISKVLK